MGKKMVQKIGLVIFLGWIFWASVMPLRDFDIWFHVKSGEVMVQQGRILHEDVFSYTGEGREWFPHEWLFEVGAYGVQQVFGFEAIKYVMAGVVVVMIGVVLLVLADMGVGRWMAIGLAMWYWAAVYEFFTARPHVIAYTLLWVNLWLILKYVRLGKNWLWATVPVTLIWVNIHGSIFLDVAMFGAYTGVVAISKDWKKARLLAGFTILTVVLTVLPPLWTDQYRMLWLFWQMREVVRNFINEWLPLPAYFWSFVIYTGALTVIYVGAAWTVWRQRILGKSKWLWPLVLLPLTAYVASRNGVLGYIVMTIIAGWTIAQWRLSKRVEYGLIAGLVLFGGWMWWTKHTYEVSKRMYYPEKATQFIKSFDVRGRLFNEYGYGGYLLYHLYPKQKVFIDGRTDLFLCCEIPELMRLTDNKYSPDADYKRVLDEMWDKHDISAVLIRTEKHTELRKMARVLTDDLKWALVFWDDFSQMFVRRDGKNERLLSEWGVEAATPYNRDPYRAGTEKLAMNEYQRMIPVADSARSRNAIGFLLLKAGKFEEGRSEFERAVKLDPGFESPYMNLAELAVKDGNKQKAIELYETALKLAPDRGLIYIRLGQLTGDESYWEEGVKKTVDDEARNRLKSLLEQ